MKKPSSLGGSMKALKAPEPLAELPTQPEQASPKPYFAATRAGKRRLTLVVEPEEHRRIKHLSADTDRSIEDLPAGGAHRFAAQTQRLK